MPMSRPISLLFAVALVASLFMPWYGWECPQDEICTLILRPDLNGWESLGFEDVAVFAVACLVIVVTLLSNSPATKWFAAGCGLFAFGLCLIGGAESQAGTGTAVYLAGYYVALASSAGVAISGGVAALRSGRATS